MNKLKKVQQLLKKRGLSDKVSCEEIRKSIRLTGEVESWDEKVRAGFSAAGHGYKGVVNDITVKGLASEKIHKPLISDTLLEERYFDAVIIGGGIIGCAVARELARYDLSIALLEKEEDLAMQTTSRNDGMIHPGFAPHPGSKKSYYNSRGNRLYTQWSRELGFELKRPGSMILFSSPLERLLVPLLKRRAKKNHVDGDYRYLSRKEVFAREPNVTKEQHGAFLLPSAGIISPYQAAVAMAENGIENGVELFLNTQVTSFIMENEKIQALETNRGRVEASVVINCGGNFSDTIASYGDDRFFSLHGRKGIECILDKNAGPLQNSIMAMPKLLQMKSKTKGGGVVPCIEGNVLLGPTAEEQPWKEDFSTDASDFTHLLEKMSLNTQLKNSSIITYFSGIRPASWEEDFIVEPSEVVDNLVHAAAIQSPGIASAPAIAIDIASMAAKIYFHGQVRYKKNHNPFRKPAYKRIETVDQRREASEKNPLYGKIICRCEVISEQEIRDVLNGPIPVSSVDALKRRIRAGAGRCHGGFCAPKVMEIISEVKGIPMTEVTRKGGDSNILVCETKEDVRYVTMGAIEGNI